MPAAPQQSDEDSISYALAWMPLFKVSKLKLDPDASMVFARRRVHLYLDDASKLGSEHAKDAEVTVKPPVQLAWQAPAEEGAKVPVAIKRFHGLGYESAGMS